MTTEYKNLRIGVLALQGDFEQHRRQLAQLAVTSCEVRRESELENLDGLIIPGGESTTMNILLDRFDLRQPLTAFGREKPIWGTCAGAIMLASSIENNQAGIQPLGLLDIDVVRNGYGRQVKSFETSLSAKLNGNVTTLCGTFIRAPRITRAGNDVSFLAEYNGDPVLVSSGGLMASVFHTELDDNTSLLEYFLRKCL